MSFDIDGTLEAGDPPGIITMEMVRRAQNLGYLIGSSSDRPIRFQQQMWEQQNITVDFLALKHQLADVKARFQARAYYHIGDSAMDEFYADRAGFHFIWAEAEALRAKRPDVFFEPLELPAYDQ